MPKKQAKRLVVSIAGLQEILEKKHKYRRSTQTIAYHLKTMDIKYTYQVIYNVNVVNVSDIPKIYKELKKKKQPWHSNA